MHIIAAAQRFFDDYLKKRREQLIMDMAIKSSGGERDFVSQAASLNELRIIEEMLKSEMRKLTREEGEKHDD